MVVAFEIFPHEFWAQAVDCAVYLLNRCTTRAVDKKTPLEAWSGKKASVSHLKVFVCVAYAHVSGEQGYKLDDRSKKVCVCWL